MYVPYQGQTNEEKVAAIEEWEDELHTYTKFAGTRYSALRWMIEDETFYDFQDVELWVFKKGILFTDVGEALCKELDQIVTYQEYK